jgi:thymidylate synthase ThyX
MKYSRPTATIILDSIAPNGKRLTTFEVKLPRIVLAEFNTHRQFSRNSASSRAIPVKKIIERVMTDPFVPVEFGKNQSGMQAWEVLTGQELADAEAAWLRARDQAVKQAEELMARGIHKQIANRILEPWMFTNIICSGTEYWNFFHQRATEFSKLAQPEIRAAADEMLSLYRERKSLVFVDLDEWHMPYMSLSDPLPDEDMEPWRQVSVARCARVSYLTHDGRRDIQEDLNLYGKLLDAKPKHYSPFEHVATPAEHADHVGGNFRGWKQLRQEIEE